jgi:hypothetical protein
MGEQETQKSEWRGKMAGWFNCGRAVNDESAMTFEACRLADLSNTEITANRSKHHEEKQLVLAGAHRTVQWLRLPLPALVSLANM